jgi:hypothetical protein
VMQHRPILRDQGSSLITVIRQGDYAVNRRDQAISKITESWRCALSRSSITVITRLG